LEPDGFDDQQLLSQIESSRDPEVADLAYALTPA
jgi:hypothetical protein